MLCLTYLLGVTVLSLTNWCQVKDRPRFALFLSTVLDLLPTTTSTNFGNHNKVSFVSMDGVGRQRLNLALKSLFTFTLLIIRTKQGIWHKQIQLRKGFDFSSTRSTNSVQLTCILSLQHSFMRDCCKLFLPRPLVATVAHPDRKNCFQNWPCYIL